MSETLVSAVILAGSGAVLDGLKIADQPKLLLPVANRSLLEYQASILALAGIKHMIVCLSADVCKDPSVITDILKDYPLEIECFLQETPRGTGGTLEDVKESIHGDAFLVLGGDLFTNVDLLQLLSFHRRTGATAAIAGVTMEDAPWNMERVEMASDHRVRTIHRIHPAHSRRSKIRPVGLYVFNRSVLDLLPDQGYFDLKEQLFSRLYEEGHLVQAWEVCEYCRTITGLDDYFAANQDVMLGRVAFAGFQASGASNRVFHNLRKCFGEAVASNNREPMVCVLEPVVCGESVCVERQATFIGPTAIGEGCEVGEGTVLNNCIVFNNVKVGAQAQLTNCILCEGAVIPAKASFREVVMMGGNIGTKLTVTSLPSCAPKPFEGKGHTELALVKRGREKFFRWKRIFDIIFSFTALTALLPLMLLIAIAIKLDSGGDIVFRQLRCGQNGRDFTMFKFRSMVSNAEDVKRQIQYLNEVDGPMFKIASDPRITRVGNFLRKTNLDELPQLLNILRGDMSLIGPRPLSREEMNFNPRWRDIRLAVRPGLTGLWQVFSHTKATFADWIQYDTRYVRECSAALDMEILVATLRNALFGYIEGTGF